METLHNNNNNNNNDKKLMYLTNHQVVQVLQLMKQIYWLLLLPHPLLVIYPRGPLDDDLLMLICLVQCKGSLSLTTNQSKRKR